MKKKLLSMVLVICMSLSPIISTTSNAALPCDECNRGSYVWGAWWCNSAADCDVRSLYCNSCGHNLDYEIRACIH